MPDLNSLPPSQTPSSRSSPTSHHRASLSPQIPSPLSRSPTSTAPAPVPPPTGSPRVPRSPRIERRRSSLLRDWSLNDAGGNASPPSGDPPYYHHQRAPSLGELHQELENEQEAQVNRLLAMIRQQQAQIQQSQSQLQQHQQDSSAPASASTSAAPTVSPTAAVASSPPGSSCPPSAGGASRSEPQSQNVQQQQQQGAASAAAAAMPPPASSLSRQSSSSARRRSRTNSHSQYSHASSPSLRPHDAPEWSLPGMGGGRDEVAFYQAETAMVQRENQMLKIRIRELERLVQGMRVGAGGASGGGESSSAQG